ncbi:GNAT family N-acetyltransferase [Motilimonas cestriensis]|uniref:GNAT family N-acetyltransferase n=1 Tax=Motilimonas cestriensis TaxID=2742685 RepID=A0ABS8WIB8_9GAMM|nr:GNAT family N-acetyltransferase [Motilimonas cestriensis]MCE2597394.1 GNAT family N-acetyltransferase [Motilimonas cestriensis]
MKIRIEKGWDLANSLLIAELYEEAFGFKFLRAIPSKNQRINILSKSFIPDYSFAAFAATKMVGLAGFKVESGSLTGGMGAAELIDQLGFFRGLWACLVFSLFDREPEELQLVMDGIAVDSAFRGQGIGSLLLDSIITYAQENNFESVRLDVIDSNPRARNLYESKGFVALRDESFIHVKWLVGFSSATTMVLDLTKIP